MTRAKYRSWLLGVAVLWLLVSTPVWAISPTMIMIYGDGLQNPIVARAQDPSEFSVYEFLWNAMRGGTFDGTRWTGNLPKGLNGRPYVKVAIFWGLGPFADSVALARALGNPDLPKQLKPEDASQHGRLYLPTASEPAAIVLTWPAMFRPKGTRCEAPTPPSAEAPCPVAVPADLGEFKAGWVLNSQDLATAKWLGIPGL